ncbi:MAG: hypothetical protein K2X82_15640, partial [Gemmataceae bacterium]|nr:hypothetical protein [Gemmataceae bacterium]
VEDQRAGAGMEWVHFQGGAIVSSAATGAHWLAGPVLAKYEALGGGGGFLGAPVEDQRAGAGMEWVHFQGGAIVSSAAAGARVVYGAILEKYLAFGGGGGMLGAPVSDEQAAGAGRVSRFERGDIYWSEATGARVVFGAVRDKYDALGGAAGFLGLPTGDLTFVGAGIMTRFQGGDIYWSGATGAHVVYGDILTKFNALGGVGFCGFPVSDEVAVPGGRASFFEDADIYWSAATGAHEVHGGFRDRYNALGGAGSRLGLPIDELRYNIDQRGHQFAGAYWYQDFQYGQL